MARPHFFIRLDPSEEKELQAFMRTMFRERRLRARRRGQAIWYSHQGWTINEMARHFGVSERNARKWLKTYQQKGLDGLKGEYFYQRLE